MEYVRFLSLQLHIQSIFISDFLLGPSLPETIIVPQQTPQLKKTVIKLERNLTDQIA
jgi:hypothetical protein